MGKHGSILPSIFPSCQTRFTFYEHPRYPLSNVPSPSYFHFYPLAIYSHPLGLGSTLSNHKEIHTAICKRRFKACRVFKLEYLQDLSPGNVDPSFNIEPGCIPMSFCLFAKSEVKKKPSLPHFVLWSYLKLFFNEINH